MKVAVLLCLLSFATESLAVTWTTAAQLVHEPNENNSSYHRLGYNLSMASQSGKGLAMHLGGTHPYRYEDFTEQIAWLGVGYRFSKKATGLQPFADVGAGVWGHYLSKGDEKTTAYVPAMLTHGGMRFGGRSFGLEATISNYFGVLRPSALVSWYAWPLMNLGLGFYVAL